MLFIYVSSDVSISQIEYNKIVIRFISFTDILNQTQLYWEYLITALNVDFISCKIVIICIFIFI